MFYFYKPFCAPKILYKVHSPHLRPLPAPSLGQPNPMSELLSD